MRRQILLLNGSHVRIFFRMNWWLAWRLNRSRLSSDLARLEASLGLRVSTNVLILLFRGLGGVPTEVVAVARARAMPPGERCAAVDVCNAGKCLDVSSFCCAELIQCGEHSYHSQSFHIVQVFIEGCFRTISRQLHFPSSSQLHLLKLAFRLS